MTVRVCALPAERFGERDCIERARRRDLALGVGADGVFENVERIDGLEGDLVIGGGHAGRQRNAAQVEEALQSGIVRAPLGEQVAVGVVKPVTGLP